MLMYRCEGAGEEGKFYHLSNSEARMPRADKGAQIAARGCLHEAMHDVESQI